MSQISGAKTERSAPSLRNARERSATGRLAWLPALVALLVATVGFGFTATSCQQGHDYPGVDAGPGNNTSSGGCVGPTCADQCAAHPVPGCSCSVEGQHLLCGKVEATYPMEGTSPGAHVCGSGFSVCTGGVWGDCQVTGAVVIVPDAPPGFYTQGLGMGTTCINNPCDPACKDFQDTPTGVTGTGLNATDAGITLNGGGGVACVSKTCAQLGYNCGIQSDGCGNTLNCGTCSFPATCGGGGMPSVCGVNVTCTNLCLNQTSCAGNGTTSISGVAYMPNGTTPLPNVLVYVPNAIFPVPGLNAFAPSVSCVNASNCTAEASGSPLVAATSALDGTFTLTNVPFGVPFPVVMQLGRFRRVFTMPAVTKCVNTPVPCTTPAACLSRFPRKQAETSQWDNIPKMAFSTGFVDALECVWVKVGIDSTSNLHGVNSDGSTTGEFTPGNTAGRINLYYGTGPILDNNGNQAAGSGAYIGSYGGGAGQTPQFEGTVLNNPTTVLSEYDMVLFPCQGTQVLWNSPFQTTWQTNLANYANSGGRVFSTHFSYIWLYSDSLDSGRACRANGVACGNSGSCCSLNCSGGQCVSSYASPVGGAINWGINNSYGGSDPTNGIIDQSFQGGSTLAGWLFDIGSSTTLGKMSINTIRHDMASVSPPTQEWVSVPGDACASTTSSDAGNCGACGTACSGATPYCANGACVASCAAGLTQCGMGCVNESTDPNNCGSCGKRCSASQACSGGSCTCAFSSTDPNNCGSCGNKCTGGQACVGGTCACAAGFTVCAGACAATSTDPNNCGTCGTVCGSGQTCVGGACTCPAGLTVCGGKCTATSTDPNNCGPCGTVCSSGQTCVGGACTCPAGLAVCAGACAAKLTDPNNCGTCGTVCGTGQTCVGGACTCPAGLVVCAGACIATSTDPNNCGACGNVCAGGETCSASACSACPAGYTNCGGTCTSTVTDPNNCGACGTVCGGGMQCISSGCACPAGYTNCSGTCIELGTDSSHCGNTCAAALATPCPGARKCSLGACTNSACAAGLTNCTKHCVNTLTDVKNCGIGAAGCGVVCPAGVACVAGLCGSCAAGFTACSGVCVKMTVDPGNCGSCGHVCSAGQTCTAGTCTNEAGYTACGATLVNLASDPKNCGSCGHVCVGGSSCTAGGCAFEPGYTACGATVANLTSDPKNCGSCGHVCVGGSTCVASACAIEPGYTACGATVANLTSDPKNCGICGHVCAGGSTCTAGTCTFEPGYTTCGATVANFNTDPKNCGSCGHVCSAGQTCNAGTCACAAGLTSCGGSCVDVNSNVNNCGACGNKCSNSQFCVAGTCGCGPGTGTCSIPMQASFNLGPQGLATPTASQCGRVVYSDFHVETSNNTAVPFPQECSGGFSPQEFMLAQALFDLAGCVATSSANPCTPISCATLNVNCGTPGDGCGGTLSCGTCTAPQTCGGGGVPNNCGTPALYSTAVFVRDYDASSLCIGGQRPVWRNYSWSSITPGDSHIDFSIATATTLAGLTTATTYPLGWSNPPGIPATLVAGQPASAHGPTPDTELGGASPDTTLLAHTLPQNNFYLRVVATLVPTSNMASTPTLSSWDMQIDCVDVQ